MSKKKKKGKEKKGRKKESRAVETRPSTVCCGEPVVCDGSPGNLPGQLWGRRWSRARLEDRFWERGRF